VEQAEQVLDAASALLLAQQPSLCCQSAYFS
jgi:hypothetical protein